MVCFNLVLVLSLTTSAVLISGLPTSNEGKRSGTLGLFPFPRVGRSNSWYYPIADYGRFPRGSRGRNSGLINQPRTGRSQPEKTWLLSPEDYPDYHNEMKRKGLIAFPRVGRALFESAGQRYNGDGPNGMWFGPRLGKFSKKNVDFEDEPWTMIALREVASQRDFTPRLGKESEESEEDQIEKVEQQQPDEQDVRQKRQSQ